MSDAVGTIEQPVQSATSYRPAEEDQGANLERPMPTARVVGFRVALGPLQYLSTQLLPEGGLGRTVFRVRVRAEGGLGRTVFRVRVS